MTAPLYLSVAWSLIISYQLFTQTAVYSFTSFLGIFWPLAADALVARMDMIVFIHAFAWIFLLSSILPSIILGKGRSVLLQFFLCLTLTFVAVSVEDILTFMIGADPTSQIQGLSVFFQYAPVAGLYLSVPYLFMLYLDIRSRKKSKKKEEQGETVAAALPEVVSTEQEVDGNVAAIAADEHDCRLGSKGRINFLFGASAVCFLFASFVFWFGHIISNALLAMTYKFAYIVFFVSLGAILVGLGLHFPRVSIGVSALGGSLQAVVGTSAEGLGGAEDLLEAQIGEPDYDSQLMKKYDVRHPSDVVDSQC